MPGAEAPVTAVRQLTASAVALFSPGAAVHALLVLGAGGSTMAHAWMAFRGGHGAGMVMVMTAMTIACAPCVLALIRRPAEVGPVRMVLVMTVGMVLVHVLLILVAGGPTGSVHGLHQGASGGADSTGTMTGARHSTLMLPLVAIELLVAALASFRLRAYGDVSRGEVPGALSS